MQKEQYIFSNGRLKRKNNTICFIDKEENITYLPVEQMDSLHVFGQIDMNSMFLNFAAKYEIVLHFYNYYGYYSGSFYPRAKKISGVVKVYQSAHYLDIHQRIYLAQSFIKGASFHMLRNLRRHKEKTNHYFDTIMSFVPLIEESKNVQSLMGVEGEIRKVYYKSFNEIIRSEYYFENRSKRPPLDELNALISFGNSLMYSAVLSEIYKTQLDPSISFLHEPSSRRFSLSLDIAEIFKPLLVDPVIFSLINNRMIKIEDFKKTDGIVHLGEEGKKKFISEWERKLSTTVKHRSLNRKVSYRYFIRLECYKLMKHFIGDEKYKPLKAWW
ncbi:hypothetical protein B4102_2377 [Heyndrickxia sporothermodurans]|uniref:CRISPR-associated endonuclease Cas1 n=1 Tax=Heyndrickxia sporothermodurans TaxID=46224 RepID=A0A150LCH0_9BACI|nr:type I-B CRISPR-associated endonuclease Cas1b [Heyndrickxia sporothermodurans]KYD09964.1 hypothetical protein B4102_2377 [Heyndrickxia sporothermodurans]